MKHAVLLVLAGIVTFPVASAERGTGPILVEMVEFAFHPATIRVRVGQSVMLRFVNRGQIAHQFVADFMRTVPVIANDSMMRVEVPGLDSLRLQPGESATLQFVPRRRGRFQFACTIEGHQEAGMRGVLDIY